MCDNVSIFVSVRVYALVDVFENMHVCLCIIYVFYMLVDIGDNTNLAWIYFMNKSKSCIEAQRLFVQIFFLKVILFVE